MARKTMADEREALRKTAELRVAMYRQVLDALICEEFEWSNREHLADNHWFQAGVARAHNGPGLLIIRECYPSNRGPGQSAYVAAEWFDEHYSTGHMSALARTDEERAYWRAINAARGIFWRQGGYLTPPHLLGGQS